MFCSAEGKRTWSHEEDQLLLGAIQRQGGPKNWGLIAEEHAAGLAALGLQPRSAKSCRLRWFNQLDPSLLRTPLTKEEEDLIDHLVTTMGTCWSAIAKQLPGRTDNICKNWWYGKFGNRTRCRKRKSQGTEAPAGAGGEAAPRLARRGSGAERRGSRRTANADSGYSTLSDSDGSDDGGCSWGASSDGGGVDVSDGEAASPARRRAAGRRNSAAHVRRASAGMRAASGTAVAPVEQERAAGGHITVAAVPAECMAVMPVISNLKRLNTGSNSRTGSQASAGVGMDDSAVPHGTANSGGCSPCSASAGRSSRMARGSGSVGLNAARAAQHRNVSFLPSADVAAPAAAASAGNMPPSAATHGMSTGAPACLPTASVWRGQVGRLQARSDSAPQPSTHNGMTSAEQLQAGISRMQAHLQGTVLAGPLSFNGGMQGPAAAAAALLQGAAMGTGGGHRAAGPPSNMHNWPGSCNSLASRASVGSYCAPPSAAHTPKYSPMAPATHSLLGMDDGTICSDYKSLSMMLSEGAPPALGWAASGSALSADPGSGLSVQDTMHMMLPPTLPAPPMPRNGIEAARMHHHSVHSCGSVWDPAAALMDLQEDAILADVPVDMFVTSMDTLHSSTTHAQYGHMAHNVQQQQQYMFDAHDGYLLMQHLRSSYKAGQQVAKQEVVREREPNAEAMAPWAYFNM